MTDDDVREALREFILTKFLPGEPPESLKDSTRLISSGIMTSLSMLELVTFIEEEFGVTMQPEELGATRMDSLDLIVELVATLRRSASGTGE